MSTKYRYDKCVCGRNVLPRIGKYAKVSTISHFCKDRNKLGGCAHKDNPCCCPKEETHA